MWNSGDGQYGNDVGDKVGQVQKRECGSNRNCCSENSTAIWASRSCLCSLAGGLREDVRKKAFLCRTLHATQDFIMVPTWLWSVVASHTYKTLQTGYTARHARIQTWPGAHRDAPIHGWHTDSGQMRYVRGVRRTMFTTHTNANKWYCCFYCLSNEMRNYSVRNVCASASRHWAYFGVVVVLKYRPISIFVDFLSFFFLELNGLSSILCMHGFNPFSFFLSVSYDQLCSQWMPN